MKSSKRRSVDVGFLSEGEESGDQSRVLAALCAGRRGHARGLVYPVRHRSQVAVDKVGLIDFRLQPQAVVGPGNRELSGRSRIVCARWFPDLLNLQQRRDEFANAVRPDHQARSRKGGATQRLDCLGIQVGSVGVKVVQQRPQLLTSWSPCDSHAANIRHALLCPLCTSTPHPPIPCIEPTSRVDGRVAGGDAPPGGSPSLGPTMCRWPTAPISGPDAKIRRTIGRSECVRASDRRIEQRRDRPPGATKQARKLDPDVYPMCTRGQFRDHGLSPETATGPEIRDLQRGAPGRIRTCATASGGRCSIP